MASETDQLAITTIRTLAIDAVQAASSGHPGTPMAMAPVAYTLWQEFLRFDPDDPIWPNRDRFVLSAGHASTLLYSLLHLAQVKAVNPAYETLGELSVPLDVRRRDDDRPARERLRDVGRHGDREQVAGRALQPRRLRALRLRRLRARRRRLHDGGHLRRGRLARGPPQALEPLLDLRQQPHLDRGQYGARVLGRRRLAVRRVRLERHPRRRRERR